MTHERARELVLDLAYGELSPAEAREVEAHLASCAECSTERERLSSARALAARAAPIEPPRGGREALLEAARDAARAREAAQARREERSPFLAFLRPTVWTAAATVALVGIVVGATLKLAGPARERDQLAPEQWSAPAAPASEAPSPAQPAPAQPAPAQPKVAQPAPAVESSPAAAPDASQAPAPAPAPAHAAQDRALRVARAELERRMAKSASPPAPAAREEQGRVPAKEAVTESEPAGRADRAAASRDDAGSGPVTRDESPRPAEKAATQGPAAPAPVPDALARREAASPPSAPAAGARRAAAPPASAPAAPAGERLARTWSSAPPPASVAGVQRPPPAPADPVVEAIERRRAAGELSELRRRPGGCVEDRRGFADSTHSQILLVVERRAGGLELRRWYDDEGHLRAVATGDWSSVLDAAGAVAREQGAVDPAVRALALEARDPSDALFGPPRGCPVPPAVP